MRCWRCCKWRCHNTPGHTLAHCCVLWHTLAHLNAPLLHLVVHRVTLLQLHAHPCATVHFYTLLKDFSHSFFALYTARFCTHTLTNRGAIIQHQTLWRNVNPFFSTSYYDPNLNPNDCLCRVEFEGRGTKVGTLLIENRKPSA